MSENGGNKDAKEEQLLIVNTPEDRLRVLRLILARKNAAQRDSRRESDRPAPDDEE